VEPLSLGDRKVIAAQIGRRPRGLDGVPVRCTHGCPQVLRVRPFVGQVPFPTTFWLSCPYLVRTIARLEASGWIERLERRIADDVNLKEDMDRAHRRYVEARAALLSDDERRAVASTRVLHGLLERGIGGIADRRRLKCLHVHVAHELADANPIGRIVLDLLPSVECDAREKNCSAPLGSGAVPTRRIDR
jgi:hypothetical protein